MLRIDGILTVTCGCSGYHKRSPHCSGEVEVGKVVSVQIFIKSIITSQLKQANGKSLFGAYICIHIYICCMGTALRIRNRSSNGAGDVNYLHFDVQKGN